ncbi:UDP-4-keto-6-deoxy-N-acetylglucosamine 4-aminotransferase [Rhodopirellula maiorica SM1]|uniref:UDP-4-keto-6-deoxy-N-acetylglucosamine 4-aminotransferase n=1 Tax=Rhodopirellula maiorica SM1 TaxID=1265738 RepID=M5RN70_9BACT|nr:UDP-4-amino-4,6-dideoxy-N-acetyl-beta-L-altrosamine transaminase [Rhodopirellula maiorica]EMI15424.1 UDP-4-keto-6-deoxy-N-acetylglucosamine 4-aminotransferase [Rhodopirellula maiorica SM1]
MNILPYGRQSIDAADLQAVTESIQSGWLTTGPKVGEFEEAFAQRVGAKHAVAVCNATAALHLAMLVSGIGSGDRVVTSPNTFLASANCAAFVGATPDFCDIDPVTYNLDPAKLAADWTPDTRGIVAVDYGGQTADMVAISKIARQHGAIVIEDACHAVGGEFEHDGQHYKIGGHPWADITTFSFHPVKTMTCGEGGMFVTDNDEFAEKARRLRSHGMVRQPEMFLGLGDGVNESDNAALNEQGPWYYEMHDLGFNYRITDFQCALGLNQLRRLDSFLNRRREIVAAYNDAFASINWIQTPGLRNERDRDLTSWHLYTMMVDFKSLGVTRSSMMKSLRARRVGTQVLYIPVYLQPWYQSSYGYRAGKCPIAEQQYQQSLSLPLFPEMSDADVGLVVDSVLQFTDTL